MILSNVFIYFLTGNSSLFFLSPVAIFIEILVFFSVLLLSHTFIQFYSFTARKNIFISKIVWISSYSLLFLTLFTAYFIIQKNSYIFHRGKEIIPEVLIGFSFLLLFVIQIFKKYKYNFLASVILIGTLFFSAIYLNFPYIIYPTITIYNGFTDPAVFPILIISFIIGSIFLIPALFLLYYLFIKPQNTEINY